VAGVDAGGYPASQAGRTSIRRKEAFMDTIESILAEKGQAVHLTSPNATVLEAARSMCGLRIGALLVCVDGRAVGIFTERDAMTRVLLARRDPAATSVEEVMTRAVVCVESSTKASEAMAIMTERRCRHLPVVHDGRVVGMVSIGDLVRRVSLEQSFEIRMLRDYVGGSYPA
jgi:CBS domain-containing protein